jgi:hypothetical protein
MSASRIRMKIDRLTVADLERYGVWEFALDEEGAPGQDETTIRPYEPRGPLDPSEGLYIVRARLMFADGTQFIGYLTPPDKGDSSIGTLQPAAVMREGQVSFWCGTLEPSATEIASSYARLGKSSASQVFPLRFRSDVALLGGQITGELPGFIVIDDVESMRTKVIA